MTVPIRFAIVGCGRVAANHLDALTRLPRAAIAGVCDLDAARAKAYSDTFGAPWYTNYHEMLLAETIDVVSIVTPSGWRSPEKRPAAPFTASAAVGDSLHAPGPGPGISASVTT